jgi:hypothetical protein
MHDDVAGQQQAEVGLDGQALPDQRRVAGVEDDLRRHLDVELGLQCGGDVDLGADADALRPARAGRPHAR